MLREFAHAENIEMPRDIPVDIRLGEAIVWRREAGSEGTWRAVHVVHFEPAKTQRRRHMRKYAEGMLIPERSFYFRGPDDRLKLRAHNLRLFLELAAGVDEATWLFHLRRGDYSAWFRDGIDDGALANEARAIEADADQPAKDSLEAITRLIQPRYTQPENPVLPNVLAPNVKHGSQ